MTESKCDLSNLDSRRVALGMTKDDLARASGIKYKTLTTILRGGREMRWGEILKLAAALKIPAAEIGIYFFKTKENVISK